MSNTWDLQRLQENREEILKAELFMLLHDVGKLHSGHQTKYIADIQKNSDYFHVHLGKWIPKVCPDISGKLPNYIALKTIKYPKKLSNGVFQVTLKQIIACHHLPPKNQPNLRKKWWRGLDPLIQLATFVDWRDSEYDRENVSSSKICQPTSIGFGVFTAFGKEKFLYSFNDQIRQERDSEFSYNAPNFPDVFHLRSALNLVSQYINDLHHRLKRRDFFLGLRLLFERAAGDTRYSVNDISLWEHSWSTAQIYKSLLAYGFLKDRGLTTFLANKFRRRQLHPQLLPLRIDGLAYLAQSNNVPDLLARRARLQKVYDTWQDILEWEFPLAGEVYRDENGPVFLTFLRDKDVQDLKLPHDPLLPDAYRCSKTLNEYLYKTTIYLTQGDLTLPQNLELITYTQERSRKKQEKSLGDLLRDEYKKGLWLQADAQCLEHSWQKVSQKSAKNEEVCAVCGLRPQGFGRWYAVEISEKEEELLEEQEKALREWLRHYQNEHRPQRRWEEKTEEERKCQVCKAISRSMCGVCFQRREARAKPWVQGIHLDAQERFQRGYPETVWLDEVADKNGRLALIVGYFPLENWLDGTLIESLAMFKKDDCCCKDKSISNHKDNSDCQEMYHRMISVQNERKESVNICLGPKPISYSRIRRVWETTRRFWQDVAPTGAPPKALQDMLRGNEYGLELKDLWEGPLSLEECLAGQTIEEKRPRIFLKGTPDPQNALGPYHAYELEIQGRKVAVLWVPEKDDEVDIPEEYRGGFWVIKNLNYLKSDQIFGRDVQEILKEKATYKVYEPTEYGRPGREQAIFTLDRILHAPNPYTPLIPILAEPRTFMALVPANKAFEVVKAIKTKYEREMGKVRNRLPLHLGIVFADSHQPLRTILDAGRRMLKRNSSASIWEVKKVKQFGKPNNPNETKGWRALSLLRCSDLIKQHPNQFRALIGIRLENKWSNRVFTWFVPAVMGDGRTEDHWYPYIFWLKDKQGNYNPLSAVIPRERCYQTFNPFFNNPKAYPAWLVHAAELEPGDIIYFTPATFDFLWIGHGGDRFRLAYDKEGRRLGTLHRPYILDELEELERCWHLLAGEKRKDKDGKQEKSIKRLSSRQLHQVRDLIEGKRAEWFENPESSVQDPTFRNFCKDVLRNAEWTDEPTEKELKNLTQWAVNGLLADAVELFYHIMKERPLKDDQG